MSEQEEDDDDDITRLLPLVIGLLQLQSLEL